MKIRTLVLAETIFLVLVFLLTNIRSSIFWSLYPKVDTLSAPAWREIFLWLLTLALMFYLLEKHQLRETYLSVWRQQPLLIGFVLFSLASVFWSNVWAVTLHRSLVFLFATLVAVYLGTYYSTGKLLYPLTLLGSVVLTASYALVLAIPLLGKDLGPAYNGAWRGIFWHRNQFGNILPIFILVFIVRFFSPDVRRDPSQKATVVLLYVFSLIAVFFTKSATGYILVLIIHFAFGLTFLWLKVRHLLRPVYYYITLAVFLAAVVGVFLNLDFIFSLFNREITLTGRVPMWAILLNDVFPRNAWLGQGFGTIWADLDFRLLMRDRAGWPYPIMIGDNGFMDILLNLGVIGLAIFLLNYIKAWVNSVRYFQQELTVEGSFPFIFMIYTFFANITFSLFMETEVFVWLLIVALMVMSTLNQNRQTPSLPH